MSFKINQEEIFQREDAIRHTKDQVLEIPDHYKGLTVDFAYFVVRQDLPRVKTLIIPKSVEAIGSMRGDYSHGPYGYRNNPFEEIIVAEDNPFYRSEDGVLYTKDMRTLLSYPCGKKDVKFQVPEGVERIRKEAFLNVEHLRTIEFPDSLICIEEKAFSACKHLDFPEVVEVFRVDEEEYQFIIPGIQEEGYDPDAPRLAYSMKQGKFEFIGEDEFCAGEEMVFPEERAPFVEKFQSALNLESWLAWGEPDLKSLFRFRKVFYSEHC